MVGVPLIKPLAGSKVKPGGKLPEATLHVYTPVPPVADKTTPWPLLYGALTAPWDNALVVIVGAPAGGGGVDLPPPQAVRITLRISTNPSDTTTLGEFIGSPCEAGCAPRQFRLSEGVDSLAAEEKKTGNTTRDDLPGHTNPRRTWPRTNVRLA